MIKKYITAVLVFWWLSCSTRCIHVDLCSENLKIVLFLSAYQKVTRLQDLDLLSAWSLLAVLLAEGTLIL